MMVQMADCFCCFHYTKATDENADYVECEWCGDKLFAIFSGWECPGCKALYRDYIDTTNCCPVGMEGGSR
jgi:hypothetical protein